MQLPDELILGWRYTHAGRATQRNGFISFIFGVSVLGIALGVAARCAWQRALVQGSLSDV